jgi:SET domain-containing protein
MNSNEGEMYVVESIQDRKIKAGVKYYLIRWKGYSSENDTWEPVHELYTIRHMIADFDE